jgi:DNA-binding CsgD family transcriptional regulator/PAS domain-containing protein
MVRWVQVGDLLIRDEDRLRRVTLEVADILREVAWGRASWDEVCRILASTLPGSAPTIVNYDLGAGSVTAAFFDGIAPDYVRSYQDYYAGLNPWMEFWRNAPVGGVFLSERDSPARLFRDTEFYADWLQPQGNLEAAAGMRFEAGRSDAVHVAWHYDVARAHTYDAPAAILLERLRPEFAAAVRDAALVRDALHAGHRLGSVIEHIDGAAFLVDRSMTILEANQEAATALSKGEVVQGLGDVLSARDSAAQRWLEETVQRLVDRAPVASTTLVFSTGSQVFRLIASLLPNQTAGTRALLMMPRPSVLVALHLLVGGKLRIDEAALKVAFGLSAAEIRLCEALINGKSLADAAQSLRLSDGTVRQRVKMIFHKTHTHRQGELIAALGRFASPV